MRRAAGHIEEQRLDLGMLFCDKETEPFYNALGWQALEPGRVIVEDDGGEPEDLVMILGEPDRPAGGHGARMELVMDLPDEAAELFRVPPEDFIVERDALVQRLRAEGRDEDATAVKALRKPTTVVWALNQLATREPDALAAVFEAGRNLQAAQQAALAGKPSGAEDLRIAGSARRDAVARARDAAVAILDASGHRGAGQADTIAVALETASTDTAAGAALASGTLAKAPSSAAGLGFGELPTMTALPGGREGTSRRTPRDSGVSEGNARRRGPVLATAAPPPTGSHDSWPTRANR